MRLFFSAGEPSGDLHGSNLIHALRRHAPAIQCLGFGGEKMEGAGCQLLFPLCQLAVVGYRRVLSHAAHFISLIRQAGRSFDEARPDAVVLIDYPGFNWWVARQAKKRGIPVYYYLPPQLWGWAGWRIHKMRRLVDEAICVLPFEEQWFREHGVPTAYVGHPFFDELRDQHLDEAFLIQQARSPGRIIGLLPGSRTQEVEYNLETLVRAAARIHAEHADTRFLVACFRPAHEAMVKSYLAERPMPYVETCSRRTAEIIRLAHSCIAVSGSVSLELLYQAKPSVVIYRAAALPYALYRLLRQVRNVCLVNLLQGRDLYPEFVGATCPANGVSAHINRWLAEPDVYSKLVDDLLDLRQRVAQPGATERVALHLLDRIGARPATSEAA